MGAGLCLAPARSPRRRAALAALLEPLKAIREGRSAFSFVRELPDEQREWLGVSRDAKRTGIDGLAPDVAHQLSGHSFGLRVVAAVHEAGSVAAASAFKHAEQYLAW